VVLLILQLLLRVLLVLLCGCRLCCCSSPDCRIVLSCGCKFCLPHAC
jgi:hypothetical protein